MTSTLIHSWNMFEQEKTSLDVFQLNNDVGYSSVQNGTSNYLNNYSYAKPDLVKNAISRIALDASLVDFSHTKTDPDTDKQSSIKSELVDRLTYRANIDQTGRAFVYDLVWSLLDEGDIAIVPTETRTSPLDGVTHSEILSMRVGKIMEWYPKHVKVQCYNELAGTFDTMTLPKHSVAIVESPLKHVLRDTNHILQTLNQKSRVMAHQDQNAMSGRINGFIQLPYQTNSDRRIEQASRRKRELEKEMQNNSFGLATLDYKETYIPAGSALQNNILEDVQKLEQDFYNQTGITESIINGTARAEEIRLYYYRTVDPVLQAILDAINSIFITKTARTQGHAIKFFRDPFALLSIESITSTADIFSRNAILTPNEIRSMVGKAPHPDPLADRLFNRNIADGNQNGGIMTPGQQDIDGDGIPDDQQGPEIYDDGNGGLVDAEGNPVDEYGNPLE